MEFITNYWVVLLVLFILLLLIILSYLIDKEIKKMKDSSEDNANDDLNINVHNEIIDSKEDVHNNQVDRIDSNEIDNTIINKSDEYSDNSELDYDELDVPNIDADFNRVIHKKKIIDSSFMDSVDALHVTELDIKEKKKEEEIILPDIKIKKEKIDNIWE